MGSYDSGESVSRPAPRSDDSAPSRSPSRNSPIMPNDSADVRTEAVDYNRPTLIALGGGLTRARIVKKVDAEYITKPVIDVIKYLISDDVAATKEEKNIADAVKERMSRSDYRAIINEFYNFHNERLHTDNLDTYLLTKERQSEGGVSKYNYADIAIVSHEEGGLEKMCK